MLFSGTLINKQENLKDAGARLTALASGKELPKVMATAAAGDDDLTHSPGFALIDERSIYSTHKTSMTILLVKWLLVGFPAA